MSESFGSRGRPLKQRMSSACRIHAPVPIESVNPLIRTSTVTFLRRSIICLASLIISPALLAAVFTVNETSVDQPDLNPGDGVCDWNSAATGPQCTLRAAIMEANASPGFDTIFWNPVGQTQTLTIPAAGVDDASTGDLNITETVAVFGSVVSPDLRPTIVADNDARIFRIEADNVTITGLRLTGEDYSPCRLRWRSRPKIVLASPT